MVELLATAGVVVLAMLAETLHAMRVRHVAGLAFGPTARPAAWARLAPAMRIMALGGLVWGFTTLIMLDPKVHRSAEEIPESEMRHLLILLDVSPSMRLADAGVDGKQSRRTRAREVIESLFARVSIRNYLVTVVAVYNGAIPVVEKTRDPEVVHNILADLPMEYAFRSGGTDLFAGLKEAVEISRPWRPGSGTLLVVSDGDAVPSTGMPRLPVSIAHSLVIGVGDSRQGMFIDGHHSKQDSSTLRQLAARLGGVYHDGNEKHIPTDVIRAMTQSGQASPLDRLTRREYALLACALGGMLIGLLPTALQRYGTRWIPGANLRTRGANGKPAKRNAASPERPRPREPAGV
ncbi:MAG TPA: vWA domain-containing protein [Pirellulales bacterium]